MRIPDTVRNSLNEKVYQLADEEGYMTNNRVENTRFIDRLVANPEIGGILLGFLEEQKVRTYIKDGILNHYTKAKREVDDKELQRSISTYFGEDCVFLGEKNDIYVFRMQDSGKTLVAAKGTYVKWETALRKVLLHLGATQTQCQFDVKRMLIILTGGVPIPAGDETILLRALSQIQIDVLFV